MKIIAFLILLLLLKLSTTAQNQNHKNVIQFIFTSDAHYGIKRPKFRNDTAVESHTVNAGNDRRNEQTPGHKAAVR